MSEHDEQAALFEWMAWNEPRLPDLWFAYAIPNGTRTTIRIAKRMKDEGVKKGVPDIHLPVARGRYHGLYIEMKVGKNKPSPEQKEWLRRLAEQGHFTICCYGWMQAAKILESYILGGIP